MCANHAVDTSAPAADKEAQLALYREMVTIRRTEEQLAKSHQQGLIHGACHTYVGEEAIAAGVCAHLRRDDAVFSTHRGHGHALAKGVPPRELIAELYGRATGCSRGRGGSMHLFAPEIGLMGTSGIVGPSILQATGAGYTFRLLKTDRVGVAFFGDGAANNGAFHEGLNLASIWKLPVLFVCENNQYATEVAFVDAAGNPNVGERGAAYGIPGLTLDGNDVEAMVAGIQTAVDRARRGDGPTLIEAKTMRMLGHAMHDGFEYVPRELLAEWAAKDPVDRFAARLRTLGVDQVELDEIDHRCNVEVTAALEHAQAAPLPDPATVTQGVYAP